MVVIVSLSGLFQRLKDPAYRILKSVDDWILMCDILILVDDKLDADRMNKSGFKGVLHVCL